MTYIDNILFQKLERLTLNSGGNLAGNTYIRFFQNKNSMTLEDFNSFKNDVMQELYLDKHTRNNLTHQQKKFRGELNDILNLNI